MERQAKIPSGWQKSIQKPIFISYTSRGRANAERLRSALKDEGIETWVDSDFIEPGESWENALQSRLREASAVVFLIGPDGQVSEQQRSEATVVFRSEWEEQPKLPLIPVIIGDPELPPFLKQIAPIKVDDIKQGWPEAARKIKRTLNAAPSVVSKPPSSGGSEQKARLLEIQQFADFLRESPAKEKFAR